MDGSVGERHQLIEHRELELEFDAVDHGLQGGFDFVIPVVFETEQDHVHGNDGQIDPDQLYHDSACSAMIDRSEQFDGRIHIYARDDKFLEGKSRHLDPLHRIEGVDKPV